MVNLSLSCNTNRRNMYGPLDVDSGGHFESLHLCVNVFVCVSKNKTLRQAALQIWTQILNL